MIVDAVIVGDTPFALSAQDEIRKLGLTTFLVYTGSDVRYMYTEPVEFPHVSCTYQMEYPERGWGMKEQVLCSLYLDSFRKSLGGDFSFFYSLPEYLNSGRIQLRIASVPEECLSRRGGIFGSPERVALKNKFMVLSDGSTVHFGKLILCESLRTFMDRIGGKTDTLVGKDLGILVEESIDMLPPVVRLWGWHPSLSSPLVSIGRGFLTYHYVPSGGKVNLSLQDYVKTPTQDSQGILFDLESKGVYAFGPRGMWNTRLTNSSEILRISHEFSTLP